MPLVSPNILIKTKYTDQQKFAKISVSIVSHSSQARLVINALTQLLLTVSQIVQFCTHVLWVERNFNMLVSKDGEVVQCGSGKIGYGSNGILMYSSVSVRVPYPNCGSDTGMHIT